MNHDINSLRSRQQEATRASILGAFLELSHDENTVSISMPMVAERAGLSVRTVYRYFPTKDELQTAGANFFNNRVADRLQSRVSVDNFDTYLKSLWLDFADELPAVLAEHATPAGRALRARRLSDSRTTVRAAAGGAIDDETVDLIIAVGSSSMFLELVDRMGHSPEGAASLATRLMGLILGEHGGSTPATPPTPATSPETGESS